MEKSKSYKQVKFSAEKLKEAVSKWTERLPSTDNIEQLSRRINFGNESWSYDSNEEFYADFSKEYRSAYFQLRYVSDSREFFKFSIESRIWDQTEISVTAPTRADIEDVFHVFEKDWRNFNIPELVEQEKELQPIIFIGHGRSTQWRELKDHLVDKHSILVEAYETGARAGHTIRDILDDMLTKSSMAFLIFTGEDELKDGTLAARPNVIHETGLFQGKLGFSRAIVLLEDGTEEFSNLFGIQQIRYSKRNIKETFGEVLATIKREFK